MCSRALRGCGCGVWDVCATVLVSLGSLAVLSSDDSHREARYGLVSRMCVTRIWSASRLSRQVWSPDRQGQLASPRGGHCYVGRLKRLRQATETAVCVADRSTRRCSRAPCQQLYRLSACPLLTYASPPRLPCLTTYPHTEGRAPPPRVSNCTYSCRVCIRCDDTVNMLS